MMRSHEIVGSARIACLAALHFWTKLGPEPLLTITMRPSDGWRSGRNAEVTLPSEVARGHCCQNKGAWELKGVSPVYGMQVEVNSEFYVH